MKKIFIANRGEIAVRIIRAAHSLGLSTVQAVSAADTEMLAAIIAGEIALVGPARASKSYLDAPAIIAAAKATGCDAIHPGYGFLSENADFAENVEAAELIFIGPKPATIRSMGDKVNARQMAKAAGVPTVPGSEGRILGSQDALAQAATIGYPVMIKASAGGGGRGIRVATNQQELAEFFDQASAEARAAFGDGGLYLEHFIGRARHVEVQILGDGKHVVHLFERECSVQRRRQKIWEEAPAFSLPEETRSKLCVSAVRLAEVVGYRGAGTLEFLYDGQSGQYFFIEMNTRIQVEHPITEMITGVDLVREMIRIAGGESLRLSQGDIKLRGHSIEVRINCEDSDRDFMPSPGKVESLRIPGGPGVRFDGMLYNGYVVPPFYDSLLGKLIVWDETREGALMRLRQALDELEIRGPRTTIPLLRDLARANEILSFSVHTGWLEQWLKQRSGPAAG